jgi:L-asparaginase II
MSIKKANPILVNTFRGKVLESFHRGVICVVDRQKNILFQLGDTEQLCYPRSALKFFQQIPLLVKGGVAEFQLTTKEVAILCGSHNGEEIHTSTVLNILEKAGFSEDDLLCGPQMPTLKKDQMALIQSGKKPGKIHNNCSGKHAGFLLLCKLMGVNHDDYIHPEHPIQAEIKSICEAFFEQQISGDLIGIDGCSAPIFAFTMYQQALAYMKLVHPNEFDTATAEACHTLVNAVQQHPMMIAGTQRYCSELMKTSQTGIIGKTGADGVYCLGIPTQKWGISIKIDDGKMGPQYNVAQALLALNGLLSEDEMNALYDFMEVENKNFGGLTVGHTSINRDINLTI